MHVKIFCALSRLKQSSSENVLVHSSQAYPELDNLIVMESLCYSANKGSDDAYDVSTSLTNP